MQIRNRRDSSLGWKMQLDIPDQQDMEDIPTHLKTMYIELGIACNFLLFWHLNEAICSMQSCLRIRPSLTSTVNVIAICTGFTGLLQLNTKSTRRALYCSVSTGTTVTRGTFVVAIYCSCKEKNILMVVWCIQKLKVSPTEMCGKYGLLNLSRTQNYSH